MYFAINQHVQVYAMSSRLPHVSTCILWKNGAIEKSKPSNALTDWTVNTCTWDENLYAASIGDENMYAVHIGDENLASIAAAEHLRHADEDQVCFAQFLSSFHLEGIF